MGELRKELQQRVSDLVKALKELEPYLEENTRAVRELKEEMKNLKK